MLFTLITRLFTGEAGVFMARLKRQVGLYVMMAIFGLALLIFAVIALFIWSSQHFGSLNTALGFCAVFLVLFIVAYILSALARRRPAKTQSDDRLQRDIASIAGVTALTNAPKIVQALRQKRGLIILPAAAAGFYGLYRVLAALRER